MKKGISWLTWSMAIFGGFILSNFLMGIIVLCTDSDAAGRLIIPIILLPIAWSFSAMWILNSKTSLKAFYKTIYSIVLSGLVVVLLFFTRGING